MTAPPRFRGFEVDGALALALLDWQREWGVDEAMLDAPVDRLALTTAVEAEAAPPPGAAPIPAPAPAPGAAPASSSSATAAPAVARAAPPDGAEDAVAAARALAAGAADLAQLAAAQQGFDGIALKRGARSFVFADGNPAARLMVIGEAPDEDEEAQRRPFAGRAGQMLDRMLGAIGLSRTAEDPARSAYLANVVTWRPPGNRRPDPAEIAASLPFLARHVELAAPDVLVLMGDISCQAGLGRGGILRLRGRWTECFGRPAMPMTHPAYLLQRPVAKREAWADLLEVAARLGL